MNAVVEIADSISRLKAIRSEWNVLIESSANSTPFHSPEWLTNWWRFFGSGQLQVALLWHRNQLIGIAPCFVHGWNNVEQLTLLGSGVSDYLEPCLPAIHAPAVAQAFLKNSLWKRAVWQDLGNDSAFRNPELWSGAEITTQPDTLCSAIPLTCDFEVFWKTRSKDLRRNLKRYGERARAQAPVVFQHSRTLETDVLESLIRLHALRWQKRGESGTIEANHAGDFLRAVSADMASSGMLRLFWLLWGNDLVAVSLGFEWKREIFSYLSAFDPAHEPLGFGRVLLYESLKQVWGENAVRWNFLRGDEDYKKSWGAVPEEKIRLIVERR